MSTNGQKVDTPVYAFVGLVGSGKTTAKNVLKDVYDNPLTDEMSNFVRHKFEAETDDTVTDNELGEWAEEQKREYGNGYFADGWATAIADDERASQAIEGAATWDAIGLAGLRSPSELDALKQHFSDVTSIVVWARPETRWERYSQRDGESDRESFEARNERELHEWGALTYFTDEDYYDYIIPNNHSSIEAFRRDVKSCITEDGTHQRFIDDPFVGHMDDDELAELL